MDLTKIIKEQLSAGAVVGNIPPLVKDNDGSPIQFFKDYP